MEITKAAKVDLEEILALQKLCYEECAVRYNDWKIQPMVQTLEQLEIEFNSGVVLKVENEGKIVGSVRAYAKDKTCYIGKLIVHPTSQNRGLGSRLMKAIEDEYAAVERYELFTGLEDKRNIYLYEKLGYKIFKRDRFGDSPEFVFMEKATV